MSPLALVLGAAAAPSTALSADPGLLETLEFQAVGLLIVMGTLFLLYLVCAGIGAAFQAAERSRRPAPVQPVASSEPADAAPADVPVVLIAAAVAAVVDQPHRVVKVEPVAAGWSLEGRRQLLTSHQPRK